uniref:Uncharacterized protein n=1 Tax=Anguilla anguilla TaxID=7936 RepID=A0A0E9QBL2_ANGAN
MNQQRNQSHHFTRSSVSCTHSPVYCTNSPVLSFYHRMFRLK